MNEQIKQFAIDCAGQKEWDFPKDPKSYTFTPDELEKFAMSIVQECLGQVEEQYKLISQDETMMSDIRWAYYVDCGVDSVVGIREHFGIEE